MGFGCAQLEVSNPLCQQLRGSHELSLVYARFHSIGVAQGHLIHKVSFIIYGSYENTCNLKTVRPRYPGHRRSITIVYIVGHHNSIIYKPLIIYDILVS